MLNKFLRNLSVLLLLNLLIKPFWVLFIDRLVQREVGDEAFGVFATLTSFTIVFGIILDPGLKNHFNIGLSKDHKLLGESGGQYLIIKLLLGLGFFATLWITALFSEGYMEHSFLLFILAANQIIVSFLLFFRATLTGLGHYQKDNIMSVMDRMLMIVMTVPIFFTSWFSGLKSIETFAVIHTIGYVLATLVCLWLLRKDLTSIKIKFEFKKMKELLIGTFPFALFTGLMILYYRIDFLMIESLLDDGFLQAGLYRKAYRFLDALAMFYLLFGNLLLPIISTMRDQLEEIRSTIKAGFKILVIPSIILAFAGFFFREEIMTLAYQEHNEAVAQSFGLFMIDVIAIALFYLFGTTLTARNELTWLNIFAAIGVVINIGMNWVFIPKIGIVGAAVATLITHGVVGLLQMWLTLKKHNMSFTNAVVLRLIGFSASTGSLFYFGSSLPWDWTLNLLALSLLSFTFALLFKVFSIKEVFVLLKIPSE